jgi:hypothetical protein
MGFWRAAEGGVRVAVKVTPQSRRPGVPVARLEAL